MLTFQELYTPQSCRCLVQTQSELSDWGLHFSYQITKKEHKQKLQNALFSPLCFCNITDHELDECTCFGPQRDVAGGEASMQ